VRYPRIAAPMRNLPDETVIDGEVVAALDGKTFVLGGEQLGGLSVRQKPAIPPLTSRRSLLRRPCPSQGRGCYGRRDDLHPRRRHIERRYLADGWESIVHAEVGAPAMPSGLSTPDRDEVFRPNENALRLTAWF
jgi:hypothetical protein